MGDGRWLVRKVIRYILIFGVIHRKALSVNEDSVFEMFGLRTQKSPQGLCRAGFQDLDDGLVSINQENILLKASFL